MQEQALAVVAQQQAPDLNTELHEYHANRWRRALEQYFVDIGFEVGFPLHHHISEYNAQAIGHTLYRLTLLEQIPRTLFDHTAEQLFYRSETIHLSLARMYSLVAKALGYTNYVDARAALNKGNGSISPLRTRRGTTLLRVFVSKS